MDPNALQSSNPFPYPAPEVGAPQCWLVARAQPGWPFGPGQSVRWGSWLKHSLLASVLGTVLGSGLILDRSGSGWQRVAVAQGLPSGVTNTAGERGAIGPDPMPTLAQTPGEPEETAVHPLFQPHIATILQSLPPYTQLRLPPQLFLSGDGAAVETLDPATLTVQVLASRSPAIATINLMTCEQGVYPCLVGSITVEPKHSPNGQRELERHRTEGKPITLGPNLRGYLWDGLEQRPSSGFSSVMWEQDNSVYTLSFPAQGRQNLLFMALYMSRTAPVTPPRVGGP